MPRSDMVPATYVGQGRDQRQSAAQIWIVLHSHIKRVNYAILHGPYRFREVRRVPAHISLLGVTLISDISRAQTALQDPLITQLCSGLCHQAYKRHIEGMQQVSEEDKYAILRSLITQGRGGPRNDCQP
eukprot:2292358-Amphidinium_carterae.1